MMRSQLSKTHQKPTRIWDVTDICIDFLIGIVDEIYWYSKRGANDTDVE